METAWFQRNILTYGEMETCILIIFIHHTVIAKEKEK